MVVINYEFPYFWEVKTKILYRRNAVNCNYMTVSLLLSSKSAFMITLNYNLVGDMFCGLFVQATEHVHGGTKSVLIKKEL